MELSVKYYYELCKHEKENLYKIKEFNKELIKEYPFLRVYDEEDYSLNNYDYEYTKLDWIPDGWAIAFGDNLLKELKEELIKYNFLNKYNVTQIKEKYRELRWYDNGYPEGSKVYDIITKYTDLSYKTCIACGKKAEYINKSWISPYCKSCAEDIINNYNKYMDESQCFTFKEMFEEI